MGVFLSSPLGRRSFDASDHYSLSKLKSIFKHYNVNQRNGTGETLMHQVILHKNSAVVHFLLHNGFREDPTISYNETCLYYALTRRNADAMLLLVEHGILDNRTDYEKGMFLCLSIQMGMLKVVSALASRLPTLDFQYPDSPLCYTIRRTDNLDMVKLLLKKGAGVNYRSCYNWLPVELAFRYRRIDVAQVLLDYAGEFQIYLIVNMANVDILLMQMIKMNALGQNPTESNKVYLRANMRAKFEKFANDCEEEVKEMKKTTLSENSSVIFYDFLTNDVDRVCLSLKDAKTREELLRKDISKLFPIYSGMLQLRMEFCLEKIDFFENGKNLLAEILANVCELPELCLLKIYHYLEKKDVIQLITFFSKCNLETSEIL